MMNKLGIIEEAQTVIDSCDNKHEILERLQPFFEPLTDLEKLIYASFVWHAIKNKFERDSESVV